MYVPAHFSVDDVTINNLLTEHGAADLITPTAPGLLATMLPFIHDPDHGERGALLGHVARNNPHWREPATGESLVIVRGRCPGPVHQRGSCGPSSGSSW